MISCVKETILNYDIKRKTATICTYNKTLMRKADKYCELYPDKYKLISQDNHSKTYEIPKKLINFRSPVKKITFSEENVKKRTLSEEHRQKLREGHRKFIKNEECKND